MNSAASGRTVMVSWLLTAALAGCASGVHGFQVPDDLGADMGDVGPVSLDALDAMVDVPPRDTGVDVPTDHPLPAATMEISPLDPVLDVTDGIPTPSVTFAVTAHTTTGVPINVTGRVQFSVVDGLAGTLDGSTGTFTPSGLGGVSHVRAALLGYVGPDGNTATVGTSVTVQVHHVTIAPSAPPDAVAHFGTVDPPLDTTALTVLYPLANTVMPRNVPAPDIQWTTGFVPRVDDLYRLRFTKPDLQWDVYFMLTPAPLASHDLDYLPGVPDWYAAANSDPGQPMTLSLQVAHADGTSARAADLPMTLADALIGGTVWHGVDYSSEFSPGNRGVVRIEFTGGVGRPGIAVDPNTPYAALMVSRNGHDLSAVGSQDPSSNVTEYHFDTLSDPPTPTYRRLIGWPRTGSEGRTVNPDGTRLLGTIDGYSTTVRNAFRLYDGATGTMVAATGLPTGGLFPDWSRDGNWLAYGSSYTSIPPFTDLWLAPVMPGDAFGPPQRLYDSSMGPPETPFAGKPTISPDSHWVVFQATNSEFQLAADLTLPRTIADLWMAAIPSGTHVRLTNATIDNRRGSHARFSPFNSGGYYWLVYSTPRPYGHHAQSVQLWVTAIHSTTDGTTDASSVPFWLTGQNLTTNNIDAFWVPTPCHANSSGCTTGNDCCSGSCEPDSGGATSCHPLTTTCAPRGASCSGDGDCCPTATGALVCNAGHLCDYTTPG